jgi:hypothetical protein
MLVYDVPEFTGFGGSVERYLLFVLAIMLGSLSSAGVGLLLGSVSSNALVGLALSKLTYPEGPIEKKSGGDTPNGCTSSLLELALTMACLPACLSA